MKRIAYNLTLLIFSAILLMPWHRASATDEVANYLVDGATWLSHTTSTSYPDLPKTFYREWAEDAGEISGYEALSIWSQTLNSDVEEQPYRATYLRYDSGKVYFLSDGDDAEWKLMYDFTLQPGEEAEICDFTGWASPYSGKVRCMKVYPLESNPELQVMELEFCENLEIKDDVFTETEEYGIRWIVGIGNIGGLIDNLYSTWLLGRGSLLDEFSVEDKLIYRSPYYTGVEEVSDADMAEIKVLKGEIIVGGNPASISAYSVDGVRCYGRDGRFSDLTPGVYVVSIDGKSRKVVVP